MSTNGTSMASKAMGEAIDLAIEGGSPYPERALFLDADDPHAGEYILRASGEEIAVVLVAEDGTSRVLEPGRKIEPRRFTAPPEGA